MTPENAESDLLAAVAPYRWLFTVLGVAPPPPLMRGHGQPQQDSKHQQIFKRALLLTYTLYSLLLLAVTLWLGYHNIKLSKSWALDNFTKWILDGWNTCMSALLLLMQVTQLCCCSNLREIFATIVALEQAIARRNGPPRSRTRLCGRGVGGFRWRLACYSGSLLVFLVVVMSHSYYKLTWEALSLEKRCLGTVVAVLLQIKCVEYCVAVQLVHELLLQLELDFQRLQREHNVQSQPEAVRLALVDQLQGSQRLVARIWSLIMAIERYFALPMLVLCVFNGLTITYITNWTFAKSRDAYMKYRITYMLVTIVNLLIPCWVSQACIDAYNRFGVMVHNLKSSCNDIALTMRLREYSLQLMHQKVLFTCAGFFDINFKFFGTMILTITTYVVILIQFKLQSKMENNHNTKLSIGNIVPDVKPLPTSPGI